MLPDISKVKKFNEKEFSSFRARGYQVENPEGLFGLYLLNQENRDVAIISVKIFGNISIIVQDSSIMQEMRSYAKKWESEFKGRAEIVSF